MNVQLTYNEILRYVKSKFHVALTVEVVDNKTLHITYKMNVFVPAINVDLLVDSVSKETLALSYDCSSIVNGLLKGVVGFIEQKIPKRQVEILSDEKRVLIHLDAFEELTKVLRPHKLSEAGAPSQKMRRHLIPQL